MTGMLASVCNLDETKLVQDVGVDIIDLKNPSEGALGALDFTVIEEIATYVNGITPLSATIGNLPFQAHVIEPVIRRMAGTGVDIIKVGLFGEIDQAAELQLLSRLSRQGVRIVLVLFAEKYQQDYDFENLASTGITGVMLDTMDKHSGSLRYKMTESSLQQFVSSAKFHELLCGLAGSLCAADIAPLLALHPDYLGFRGGLCQHSERINVLDKVATYNVRRQIPQMQTQIVKTAAII